MNDVAGHRSRLSTLVYKGPSDTELSCAAGPDLVRMSILGCRVHKDMAFRAYVF